MSKTIVIIGAGFAGTMSALSAAKLRAECGSDDEIDILLVAPEPVLSIRPRLYEADPLQMSAPLKALFDVTNVRFVSGFVRRIDTKRSTITVDLPSGEQDTLLYDRLVLAAGSRVVSPPISGLDEHAFSVDQRDEADELWQHVHSLADRPRSAERDTVVVAGGGFTGIETAAEMPARLRSVLGEKADIRVIIVERASDIGPDLGPGPRPVIEEALRSLGIELILGRSIVSVDAGGVTLDDGARIASSTVVWTGGLRASPLTEQIDAPRDALGRLVVDADLRVPGHPAIFATGDAACAMTDGLGHQTLMCCQHAMPLGRFSGHNAAADLLHRPALPYSQERYVTCLDLGPWGAVFCEGWDRKVTLSGSAAKPVKQQINSTFIYPPKADRETALAAGRPGITADV
ncbi:NAD(P)/FAD-dependent oxidoreductase [Pseudoroseomonas globiformis]|uniref:NAD(P)/FAD-dependent oxidoreductase n=1 Tax=Teichococcus globiformis TaxID=2307229 RepID=A0ABV7G3Y1_9PROT